MMLLATLAMDDAAAQQVGGALEAASRISPSVMILFSLAGAALSVGVICAMIRLIAGPSLPDRVVALDLMGNFAVAMICAFAVLSDIPAAERRHRDGAGALFLGTVAFAVPRSASAASEERVMNGWIGALVIGLVLLGVGFSMLAIGVLRMPDACACRRRRPARWAWRASSSAWRSTSRVSRSRARAAHRRVLLLWRWSRRT